MQERKSQAGVSRAGVIAIVAVVAIAALAAVIPALRALRVDPAEALRTE